MSRPADRSWYQCWALHVTKTTNGHYWRMLFTWRAEFAMIFAYSIKLGYHRNDFDSSSGKLEFFLHSLPHPDVELQKCKVLWCSKVVWRAESVKTTFWKFLIKVEIAPKLIRIGCSYLNAIWFKPFSTNRRWVLSKRLQEKNFTGLQKLSSTVTDGT